MNQVLNLPELWIFWTFRGFSSLSFKYVGEKFWFMDLLGKEGEKAAEGLESIMQRLNQLESHLNAVDSAVQDMGNRVQAVDQNSVGRDELAQMMNRPEDEEVETRELKDFFVQLSKNQKRNERRIDDLEDLESDLVETLQRMQETVKEVHIRSKKLDSRLSRMEDKFSDVDAKVRKHEKKLRETEEIKKELKEVEREQSKEENQEDEGKSFEERQRNVEEELKDLRGSIKQFADRVDDQ